MNKKLDAKILMYLLVIFIFLMVYNYSETIINWVRMMISVVEPLIFGGLIAYLLNIIVVRLERTVLRRLQARSTYLARALSVVSAIFIIGLVIYLIIKLIVPQVSTIITGLIRGLPLLVTQIQTFIEDSSLASEVFNYFGENLIADFNDYSQRILNFATNSVSQFLTSFVQVIGGATSGLFSLVIAFSFALYVLFGKERLLHQVSTLGQAFLSSTTYRRIAVLMTITNQTFSSFFVGQTIEAVILGSLCTIGMLLLRFPFALTIGTFIGFTALIPLFGALIGAAVGFLLIASQSITQALLFIIFIIVLQQLETNLIYPRVVGTSIGIPGIWVLVAITIGGGLGGIAGMLLGVPTFATVYQVVGILTHKRLQMKAMAAGE
ncbi:AI-2E family transporter [Jeotgalibaca sp. A127]|uniref:AI-2E family transporter n=1 Tax=Jeotgalibaca sp. A127 TaxID=3457324 RepID=UPI003FD2D0EC